MFHRTTIQWELHFVCWILCAQSHIFVNIHIMVLQDCSCQYGCIYQLSVLNMINFCHWLLLFSEVWFLMLIALCYHGSYTYSTYLHIYALIFIAVWEIMYNHYDHVSCILIFISQEPPKLYIQSRSFEQYAVLCYSLTIFGKSYILWMQWHPHKFNGRWQTSGSSFNKICDSFTSVTFITNLKYVGNILPYVGLGAIFWAAKSQSRVWDQPDARYISLIWVRGMSGPCYTTFLLVMTVPLGRRAPPRPKYLVWWKCPCLIGWQLSEHTVALVSEQWTV